ITNNKYLIVVGEPLLYEKVNNADIDFYSKNTPRYPINSKKITTLAKKVINDEKKDEIKIEKLMNFVSEYIEDDYESNSESVLDIIDKKKGDCTEHSLLFTTMSRSMGFPTREVTGWAYDGNKKYVLHAWVEVALKVDGEFYWIPIDPTWNLMVPLIHIRSSGKNFLNSDLSITLKQISFADGQKFN
ncbi:MAG: transglutaminase-like domain-containing protein, partial [Flavobacteriaceae bacterium]|nr:transglutaminase-like domain-containing protein [Flavobacteriaceae bacterium]